MAFNQYVFSDIVELISEKIKIKDLKKENYISTDNMLPNFGGITLAENLPNSASCNRFAKKDILFSNIRTYFKKVWLAEFSGGCSPDVLVMRSKNTDILLNEYLFLLIRSDDFINFTVISANGAKMPRGDKNAMKGFIFNIPSIEYQKKCIANYFAFDQKIQLNTQTNQTLEAIAQAIFKSWFVDFDPVRAKAAALSEGKSEHEANLAAMSVICGKDTSELNDTEYKALWQIAEAFPSEFGDEGLPIGWKFNQADNLFDVGIGKTPPRKESEWFSDNANDTEWISIKDMGNQGLFITESSEYLKAEAVDTFNIKRIPENTVILSFKLTVGRVSITTKETTTNEAIAHFKIPSSSNLSSEFLYCYLKNFDFNNLGSTSSIATAVNSKMIKEM
ncbi:TPA: restriction endonuclease subunit S, partial [Mannheimia haemolytica]|nr:restriction endonuclease subunit S [Mannheimia haemolytica]HDL4079446.1 restriction endonuclease subunit S [Mannheimia haemolytica]HDL4084771.1 restriction endonuclease subunit S [Mannheimia haemolytica]HDL5162580.1 restriction endonuclease subunit S [Mannheimia haemolytica]HDV7247332.1 restriction endonuclease subunit S [Mannheimia haemolytica]